MKRLVGLFTGTWTDLSFQDVCVKARECGYDAVELACWGDHFNVTRALSELNYCAEKRDFLLKHRLVPSAIANHLISQAVCDDIDDRHEAILPQEIWGSGDPEGVRARAAEEMIRTGLAAKRLGVKTVVGFMGHPRGSNCTADIRKRWTPILDSYFKAGVRFALEVHPNELACDLTSTLEVFRALQWHPSLGINFKPHQLNLGEMNLKSFLSTFRSRLFHVHLTNMNRPFRFEGVIRSLNDSGYCGALSLDWNNELDDRDSLARAACTYVKTLDEMNDVGEVNWG